MRVIDFFSTLVYFISNAIALIGIKRVNLKRIAFVKIDAIGDFLIWLDAAEAAAKKYGPNNITLITSHANASLAHNLPFWEKIILIDKTQFLTSWRYRHKMLRLIRGAGIDKTIHFTHSREFRIGDAVVWATGARERIGSSGDTSNISPIETQYSNIIYSTLHKIPDNALHEAVRNQEFLHALGIHEYTAGIFHFQNTLGRIQSDLGSYFTIFPGASWKGKQWEKEKFVQLINQLSALTNLRCLLAGGENEIELCEWIIQRCDPQVNVLSLAGKTNFLDFLELVRASKFLVSNDSSGIHAAAVMRTPAVCISGGGHFGRFIPYEGFDSNSKPIVAFHQMSCFNCNWKCTQQYTGVGPVPCISNISVKDVLDLCNDKWWEPIVVDKTM